MPPSRPVLNMPHLSVWSFALWRNDVLRVTHDSDYVVTLRGSPEYQHYSVPIPLDILPLTMDGDRLDQPFILTVCRNHDSIGDAVATLAAINDEGFWGVAKYEGTVTLPLATWVGKPVWSGAPAWHNIGLPDWITRSILHHLEEELRLPLSGGGGLYAPWRQRTPLPLISAQEWCAFLDDEHLPLVVSSPLPVHDCWREPDTGVEDSPIRIPSFVPQAWMNGPGWYAVPFVQRRADGVRDATFNPLHLEGIGEGAFIEGQGITPSPSSLASVEGRRAVLQHISGTLAEVSLRTPGVLLSDFLVAGVSDVSALSSMCMAVSEAASGPQMSAEVYDVLDTVHRQVPLTKSHLDEISRFLGMVDHLPTCDLRDVLSGSRECSCGVASIRNRVKYAIDNVVDAYDAVRPYIFPF